MDQPSSKQHFRPDHSEREKYVIGSPELAEPNGATLPENYGEDRLVLLPRDPLLFFSYWEITPGRAQWAAEQYGSDIWDRAALVLRVYDLGGQLDGVESAPFVDVEVSKQSRSGYARNARAGLSVVADLGLRLPDGRFISLIRSNRIQMPRGRISEELDTKWMAVTGQVMDQNEWDRYARLTAGVENISAGASAEFSKSMAQRWEFLKSVFSGSLPSSASSSSWLPQAGTPPEDKK